MKHLRLVALVLAVFACCAAPALAGGRGKSAKAAGSGDCCGAKATATAASASGACPATMNCPAGSSQCTAAQREQCAKASRTTTAASMGTCSMHGAATAAAGGNCSAHGNAAAAAAASGCSSMSGKSAMAAGTCTMHGVRAASGKCDMAGAAHGDCAVCADEMACDDDVRGLNSHAQVVELRNGTMIVYTADTPENVRALQAALSRHNEHIMNALATNSEASLCGGCKSFRGAMASGKFKRELVNVKTGAQVLLTSNDRAIVQRIHDMTGAPTATTARTKS